MAGRSTRREFLKTVSLAGAALVVGEGTAGATNGTGTTTTAASGKRKRKAGCTTDKMKKVWACVDENGCLNIDDDEMEAKLYAVYTEYGSICVSFDIPGSDGNRVNSLCNC